IALAAAQVPQLQPAHIAQHLEHPLPGREVAQQQRLSAAPVAGGRVVARPGVERPGLPRSARSCNQLQKLSRNARALCMPRASSARPRSLPAHSIAICRRLAWWASSTAVCRGKNTVSRGSR
ncbi:MAG: hypothetical protein ACK55I_40505, partial [bacterium]